MAGRTPTPAQREVILRDGHTLIEAGAGSGKTTTLVDKIVHLLEQGCELGAIAAITFTNASAADFRKKLRQRLREKAVACGSAGDVAGERLWLDRVHEVDRARIGTIHSFCGGILREFGLRIGLDPRFRILDEGEGAMLRDACTRDVMRDALEADDQGAVDLCAAFGVNGAQSLVEAIVDSGTTLDAVLGAWFSGDAVGQAKSAVEALRASLGLADGEGAWDDALDGEATHLAACALGLARAVRTSMDEQMTREAILDYDALVERTLAAVRDRADVRGALRSRLRWLFIDEFQDTDAAQLAIAEAIAALDEPPTATSPRLCIVGDPKQSIYRFRGADVTVWTQAVQRFAKLGIAPIVLDVNFRSLDPIVGFVNATFDGLIGEGRQVVKDSGHEVAFTPLRPHRRPAVDVPCVELLAPEGGSPDKADERRACEAKTIAARILQLREQPWHDDDGVLHAAPRPWNHIALLFRTRDPMAKAEEQLRQLGIPCYVAGGSGFFARREVRDIRLLLRALADPTDDIAWIGLLRSPFIGVTDAAILRMKATRQDFASLACPMDVRVEDEAAIARARGWFIPLRDLRDRVSVAQLIDMAVERSGFGAHLLALPGGRLALANVRKLVRLAEGRAGETIREFLAWVEERETGDARDGDAALYTAGEDVVTLSTVHGAKGLEWPVVVLADIVERNIISSNRTDALYVDAEAGVGLKVTGAGDTVSAAWTCLDHRNTLLARAEEKRLWYVAATRARDLLVLCAAREQVEQALLVENADADAKLATQWLLRSLVPGEACFTFVGGTAPERLLVPQADPQQQECAPAMTAADAEMLRRRLVPVNAIAPLPRRSATELMQLAQGEEGWRNRFARSSWFRRATGIAPRILGDVVHGALEELREAQELRDYLEAELVRLSGEPAESAVVREAVARARELVASAQAHPDVMRFMAAGAERELEFTWFARTEGGAHHVRGAMDLVGVIDGVPEILDYKSTAIEAGGEADAAAPYRLQRDTYALAIHALLGVAPSGFTFVFPATGGAHASPIDAASLEAGLAEVRVLLDQAVEARS